MSVSDWGDGREQRVPGQQTHQTHRALHQQRHPAGRLALHALSADALLQSGSPEQDPLPLLMLRVRRHRLPRWVAGWLAGIICQASATGSLIITYNLTNNYLITMLKLLVID